MSIVVAIVLVLAGCVLLVGLAWRIATYTKTPAPLFIAVTPAPLTKAGVVLRMGQEILLFRSLFGADLFLWVSAVLFHLGLLLVLLRHLRYFLPIPPEPIVLIQPFGKIGALAMGAGLLLLLARRIVIPRIRYISAPSDYAMLGLLLLITISGGTMTLWLHTDIMALKSFLAGIMSLRAVGLPGDPVLWIHLGLVAILCIVLPFSKLLHIPGVFFAPSRTQVDDARTRRRLAPWAAALDGGRDG